MHLVAHASAIPVRDFQTSTLCQSLQRSNNINLMLYYNLAGQAMIRRSHSSRSDLSTLAIHNAIAITHEVIYCDGNPSWIPA